MTTAAQKKAIRKYQKKTFRKVNIALRQEEDADIIRSFETARKAGKTSREWLREIFFRNV